jgi:hypothetical protein
VASDPAPVSGGFADERFKLKTRPSRDHKGVSPPNPFSTIVILAILAAVLAATAYGFLTLQDNETNLWPPEDLWHFGTSLAVPASLLLGLSFLRQWPRLALGVVFGAALITYGPAAIFIILFCAAGFIAIGQMASRLRLETIEDGLLALAIGFGIVGLVVGLTAPLRIHFDFVYAGIMSWAILTVRGQLFPWISVLLRRAMTPSDAGLWRRTGRHLATALILLLVIGVMLFATAVESGPDALSTHFAYSEALREYGFIQLDADLWRTVFMPKGSVWGLSVVHVIGGEFALRAANASLLPLAAALLAMRASRSMGKTSAALLAASLLSAPVCFWISAQFFEESGAIFLISAAVVFFLRAETSSHPHHEDWRAFAALGLAVSAKTQVLFLGVLGVSLVLRRLINDPTARGFRDVIVGSTICAVLGVGFYLRAFLLTGNPFFPFVAGEGVDPRWERPLSATTPLDMVFNTGMMEAYAGGFAFQFLLLIGAGIAVLAVPPGRSVRWLGLTALIFCLALATQTLYARYQIYAFPLFMLALAALYPLITVVGRVAVSMSLVLLTVANLGFWRSVHVQQYRLEQLLAPQTSSYIAPERRAFDALDALYGRDAVVYVAGPSDVAAGSSGQVHATTRLSKEIDAAGSVTDMARLMRAGEISHIVVSGEPSNPNVLELCRLACRPFPLAKELGLRLYEVDAARMSIVADRIDAAELFGLPPPAEAIPLTGWDKKEDWGWWSIEPRAEARLVGFGGATEVGIHLLRYSPPGTEGLNVRVSLDGVLIADWRFDPGPVGYREERRIRLSSPIDATKANILSFEFSRTYSPSATMGGSDQRSLAMGLIGVSR